MTEGGSASATGDVDDGEGFVNSKTNKRSAVKQTSNMLRASDGNLASGSQVHTQKQA